MNWCCVLPVFCCGSWCVSTPHCQTPASCVTLTRSSCLFWSTQLTLPLQPFTDNPTPSPTCSGSSSRSSNREQASLLSARLSLSSSSPHPLGVQLCWLSGGPFSPLSVCSHWSLCPRAREQCARIQTEGRRLRPCHSLLLLQGAPVPFVFPQPSVGALDRLWVPSTSMRCECRKAPQPCVFSSRTPATAVSSSRMFPQRVSGLPCFPV